jgi:predicted PurR-regulated permease PerM
MIFIGVILGILGLACFMAVWDAVRRWDEDDHDF